MSELYTSEPPTSGKVIVETNYGNIDIELFTLEAPKSSEILFSIVSINIIMDVFFSKFLKIL